MKPPYVPFFSYWQKNIFPYFHASRRKKILFILQLTKINFLWENISAEGMSCAIVFPFIIRSTFSKEQLSFVSPHLFSDAK